MRLYLAAEIRFIKQRRCYTQRQIAAEIDVSEEQVSRWHKVRGYDDWRRDALVAEASREWGPMLLSCAQRVKETGDYRGLEVLGEVFGLIDRTTPNASRAPIVPSIVTLIPSPGMDPEPWIRHRIELPESDP